MREKFYCLYVVHCRLSNSSSWFSDLTRLILFSLLFMVCLVLAVVSSIKAQYKAWWKPHPAQSKRYPGCCEPFMKVVSRQVPSSRWRYVNKYDDFVIGSHPLPVKMSLHWWKRSDSIAPLLHWNFAASLRVIIVLAYNVQFSSFKSAKDSASSNSFLSYNSLQGSIRSACIVVNKHILPVACIAQLSILLCRLVDIS